MVAGRESSSWEQMRRFDHPSSRSFAIVHDGNLCLDTNRECTNSRLTAATFCKASVPYFVRFPCRGAALPFTPQGVLTDFKRLLEASERRW